MSAAVAVALLVVCDAALAGFRASAGRDGRIAKRRDSLRALVRGALAGLVIVAANLAFVAVLRATASDPDATWRELLASAGDAAVVFGAFAALTLVAIALWFVPVPEVRLVPTLVILGPLTLVRPVVIVGGLAWVAFRSAEPRVWIAAVAAAVSMLAVEALLARAYTNAWRKLIG
jgi:hypothetical protein